MSKISKNIRKYRRAKGLKQSEIAVILDKSPSVISTWENDCYKPDIDIIEQLCRILDVDPNTLYGWVSNEIEENREALLLEIYRDLNEEAQEMILSHAEGLEATGKYKKDNLPVLVEKGA